jgi:tetratricopeptide (TPR) repeat protein
MESSGWNIVVAGIGVFDEEREEAVDHQHGSNLSAQIARKLDDYDDANLRLWDDPGVGFVTGTADEREERAEAIAKTLNANVVVYGVITETVSGIQATFTPEFYVNDTGSLSAFAYATEILGAEQFGKPVTYTLGVPDGDSTLNDAMDERLSALRYFVRGLRLFVADNYASARVEFCSAILQAEHIDNRCVTVNEPNAETDTSHTAVVHLYLGALEFREGNLDDAFRHAVTAQEIWPEYPRPLMTKGALFSSLANAQYAEVLAGTYSPPPQAVPLGENVSCVEIDTIPNLTIEDNLKLAQRCYEAALELVISDDASRVSAADVEPKVLMSLGSIAFILADIGHAEWQTAREIYHEVIAIHAAAAQAEPPGPEAEDDEDKQPEPLERMAAHASARLGYIIVCEPDCSDPRP